MIPKEIIYAACLMMFIALLPMPYGYYTLLRICAFGLFGLLAYDAYLKNGKLLPWLFGFMAVVYNPIFKVHFLRETWEVINVASAIILLATIKHTINKEITPK